MKHKIFAIFLTAFIGGCSIPIKTSIDSRFANDVAHFESLYNVKIAGSVIFTEAIPGDGYGLCKNYGVNDIKNIVYINRGWWDEASLSAREQLLFHEFGHCVFGLKHSEGLQALGEYVNAPKSIMYYMPFGEFDVYPDNIQFYYDELNLQRGAVN